MFQLSVSAHWPLDMIKLPRFAPSSCITQKGVSVARLCTRMPHICCNCALTDSMTINTARYLHTHSR